MLIANRQHIYDAQFNGSGSIEMEIEFENICTLPYTVSKKEQALPEIRRSGINI